MKLKELLKELKVNLMIDDSLKAYLYKEKIEIIDYTPTIELPDGDELEDFYGVSAIISVKNNKITIIEKPGMDMITPANRDVFMYLANLIGTEIEDYSDYPKLPDIRDIKNFIEI